MNRHHLARTTSILASLLLVPAVLLGDEVVLKKGRVPGVIVKTEGGRVHVNPYNSRNPRMTYGVETYPEKQVKSEEPLPGPERAYLRELCRVSPPGSEDATTADEEFALGKLAAELKLGEAAERHFLRALLRNENHAGGLSRIEAGRLAQIKKSDPRFNAELAEALAKWMTLETPEERKAELTRLQREYGYERKLRYLERARRSAAQGTGLREDVVLTLDSKTVKGVYTIFVPKSYDPLRPWPLVIGLHGGGADGKDRQDVVGSGRSAMNFYRSGASRYGYIVACPTAVRAPWANRMNDGMVRSVLEEVCLLFNVDLNRVYLTGHSMGGFGTWYFGPRYAHLWAAIGPMSGGGFRGTSDLERTMTPVYLYHGADDPVVGCSNSRQAAEAMRRAGHDFVYTEIPDSGHGFPADVNEEMWAFFHRRRLAVAPRRAKKGRFKITLEALSSFERPVSQEERLYFGAPGDDPEEDLKTLLARVRLGGGAADDAADVIVRLGDPGSVRSLAALVASAKQPEDVRRVAARALGEIGFAEAGKGLIKGLKKAPVDLVPSLAEALGRLGDGKAVKPLSRAVQRMMAEFEDRLTSKTRMAFSDWKRCHRALGALARALGALGDPAGMPALEAATEKVLLPTWNPSRSERAGTDPDRPLGRCVVAFVEACGRLGGDRALALIDRLAERHGTLEGVGEAVTKARSGGG